MTEEQRIIHERTEEKRIKALVSDVQADFLRRQEERKTLERSWQLNMNFVSGNQYCDISSAGELTEEDPVFYWQSRKVFNHIAPTIDTRLARLAKVRPKLTVRAFSDTDEDIKTAKLGSGILDSVKNRIDLDSVITRASVWSETCGTAFYKVVWNYNDGRIIGSEPGGAPIREGDVNVVAVPPFEVYPDCLSAEKMEDVKSLIHAKAVPVSEIKEKFGVEVAGETIGSFSLVPYTESGGWRRPMDGDNRYELHDHAVLIERYVRPCSEFPKGRLEIVAGDKLLFEGDLPYLNSERGERTFPFIRQTCIPLAGSFFGTCIVDRMIPLQRAYNAVRNRKHEFLNRLSMGVMAVEDGSVDTDELEEEGLYPGKVLVYRQGSKMPDFLNCGNFPSEFAEEEERISSEFILVSGMSEISRNSANPTHVTSAVGLQLLIDQDTNRMTMSVESVEQAVREIGKQVLRLYKQFASVKRMLRMTGSGGKTEMYYFDASDISADDIQFETGYEYTEEQKKQEVLSLLNLGLLYDKDGKLSDETRNRVLEALGYGSFENARDISHLHLKKAERENVTLRTQACEADDYDDHELHIVEHTRALLSGGEEDGAVKDRILRHIEDHRRRQIIEE